MNGLGCRLQQSSYFADEFKVLCNHLLLIDLVQRLQASLRECFEHLITGQLQSLQALKINVVDQGLSGSESAL
ncbi:hypothetical protein B9Z47_12765 [Limnohabitans sp. 2KL-1]|nr:hypothetical protein B9Z47_12765 [Limnohabitans sp. 2KL-1]